MELSLREVNWFVHVYTVKKVEEPGQGSSPPKFCLFLTEQLGTNCPVDTQNINWLNVYTIQMNLYLPQGIAIKTITSVTKWALKDNKKNCSHKGQTV